MTRPTSLDRVAALTARKKAVFAALASCLGLVVGMLLSEAALRAIDALRTATRESRPLLDYGDTWREAGIGRGGFLKESFSGEVSDGYGRPVRWVNNSAGFRSERDFAERPAAGVLRVLSLGDSFVAGFRVAQGRTLSDRIGHAAEADGIRCEMLISCIESPNQGLGYLRTEGHKWNPHVVLLSVTLGNDIAQDYIGLDPGVTGFRHGLQKQNLPAYCLSRREPSFFEGVLSGIRRNSHLVGQVLPERSPIGAWYGETRFRKMFDPCTGLGFFIASPPPIIREAFDRHCRVLGEFDAFCRARDITFVVALLPQRFQVQPEDWAATVAHYRLNASSFDLRFPNGVIGQYCRAASIPLVDPIDHMASAHRASGTDMFLPLGDMHFNEEGHRICAEGIWAGLRGTLERADRKVALPGGVSDH
jgi:hypothetical protein